jgi:membrane-bound hydrogenase subunit beta
MNNPASLEQRLRKKFGKKIKDVKLTERVEGKLRKKKLNLWIVLESKDLKPAIKWLLDLEHFHLTVISGRDAGESIELLYTFLANPESDQNGFNLVLRTGLPKDKPELDSICDLIPGAEITEREKQEMLGVRFRGIPNPARFFLPDEMPENCYPWRKDEKGIPEKMVKKLWEVR